MNKTLLLTGASGGIGTQLIKPLSDAGFNLLLHYHTHLENLEAILDQVKPRTKVACVKADLTHEEEVQEMVNTGLDLFDSIDILVNNAGISATNISWKENLAQWNQTIAANLTSTFLTTKHLIPIFKKQNFGRIINNSSVVAQIGMPGTSAYAASKAGIVGFTRSVAKELSKTNVTANVLSYGYMNAGMIDELSPQVQEQVLAMIPKGTFGEVDNIAEAIQFLSSEKADYINGQTININGGMF